MLSVLTNIALKCLNNQMWNHDTVRTSCFGRWWSIANSLTIQKVKSDETVELPLDALIVSFGFSTSNKNLKNWNVDYKRSSITVSPLFETSQEGVYAIGDAADYEGKVALIASGFGEAPTAINQAIKYIYPDRDNRVVHSTSLIKTKKIKRNSSHKWLCWLQKVG